MSGIDLSKLPPKLSVPFSRLLQTEQVDEDTIATVIEAGSLDRSIPGNPAKLLGFLSGYLSMQARGIHVKDTIRMAAKARRRLNLGWSAKRWQQEHDRLSRAETLARLAGENVAYDLAVFARHLPARFPGYLVPSSRRLGMEGLRQRHCVASYHNQVVSGACAIAVVFIDHVRWTVQVMPTREPERPLRIGQIRTRFNESPTGEARKRIHDALGIEMPTLRPSGSEALTADAGRIYESNLRRVLPVLRELGAGLVIVDFDGSGDSGSIDSIDYGHDLAVSETAKATEVGIVARRKHFDGEQGRWITVETTKRMSVTSAIEEIAYDYLSATDVNWYDNDGGYGTMEIDVGAGTVSMEVNTRFTESVEAFARTFDIETGEDIDD